MTIDKSRADALTNHPREVEECREALRGEGFVPVFPELQPAAAPGMSAVLEAIREYGRANEDMWLVDKCNAALEAQPAAAPIATHWVETEWPVKQMGIPHPSDKPTIMTCATVSEPVETCACGYSVESSCNVLDPTCKRRSAPADERAAFAEVRFELETIRDGASHWRGMPGGWSGTTAACNRALDALARVSANETGAEGAKTEAEIRKTMTPEQIQLERKLTCEAIDGAMAFGYQNTNPPPSADHWLAPYWHVGRKQEELESAIADVQPSLAQAAEPMPVPAGWKLVPIEPTESMVVDGFESWPAEFFSEPGEWEAFEKMTGCQQAAHKARLCYAAMLAAAPQPTAQAGALIDIDPPQAGGNKGKLPALARTREGGNLYSLGYNRGLKKGRDEAAQAHAREGLADEQIIREFYMHAVMYDEPLFTFDRQSALALARALLAAHPGQPEPRRSENPTGIGYDTPPEELERILAQGEPRAEVTDEQIADMFERVTGYSIENGRAALNDADILGFARELLDAARAGEAS